MAIRREILKDWRAVLENLEATVRVALQDTRGMRNAFAELGRATGGPGLVVSKRTVLYRDGQRSDGREGVLWKYSLTDAAAR